MASQVDGIDEVNRKLNEEMKRISGPMTERFITEVMIAGNARAATYTPVSTSALINSQYRKVTKGIKGWTGEFGYGAKYAAAVHDAPGTLLNTNTPRHPARLGTVWGPNGEPGFLEKGVEEMIKDDLSAIIARNFKS